MCVYVRYIYIGIVSYIKYMIHIKYILLSVLMLILCSMSFAAAEEVNQSEAFDEITAGIFDDLYSFLMTLAIALVSIFAVLCIIWMVVGWFTHDQAMFTKGAKGCLIILAASIVYFIATNGFEYIRDNYW